MSESTYDLIVIGGGPAGYTAAIRAAQLGLEAACVDNRPKAGGTCLHVGCIPSKALLSSTRRYSDARCEFEDSGTIAPNDPSVELFTMMRKKDEVVKRLTHGVDQLLKKNGVDHVQGRAMLIGSGAVRVANDAGDDRQLFAKHIVLATGSTPVELSSLPGDGQRVLTSTDSLSLKSVPEKLTVIGGGYIGLELGSVWHRLGADVTIVELEYRLLPQLDTEISDEVARSLESQGISLRLGHRVEGATVDAEQVTLHLQSVDDRDVRTEHVCTHVLVAVGREPSTHETGLENAGVRLDPDGFIHTDGRFRTTAPGVYAIGDVARAPMLAHKGQLEAIACVDAIAGRGSGFVHYAAIPSVVYTWPEVASVGQSEAALQKAGIRYRVGRSSFRHDSRALCTGQDDGFVKILVGEDGCVPLGAHIFGPHAGSLIHEIVIAMEFGLSVEELGRCPHAHPTLNEAVREAALDVSGRAIHR